MARVSIDTTLLNRATLGRRILPSMKLPSRGAMVSAVALLSGALLAYLIAEVHASYVFNLQTPVRVHMQLPVVVSPRVEETHAVQQVKVEQHSSLDFYQQYACEKFGPACATALAIQRAENPTGKCEVYHYNTGGSLDWGYFQINTVHLKRKDVNLRDLLDCKANIDFAYKIYRENGFAAWSTYKSRNGRYLRALRDFHDVGL